MDMIRHHPTAPLNAYVDCLWWSQRELPQCRDEHMLPSSAPQLIIALHDRPYTWRRTSSAESAGSFSGGTSTTWTRGIVHGPQWAYFVSGPKPIGAVVGVAFRPGAAGALLGVPMTELTDRHIDLEAFWGSRGRSLHQRLWDAGEPRAALRFLERELISRITRPLLIHPAVAHALAAPARGWGFSRIAHVQRQTGYSHRHFIALFRNVTGLTPKHYYRQGRFSAALHALAHGRFAGLAELAASVGYADQAHLTREFRELAGTTPTHYQPSSPDSLLHHIASTRDYSQRR